MNILLVEDDEDISELIEIRLKEEGHCVSSTIKGQEALELVRTKSFDAFILDLRLPDVQGLDVTREIRKIPHYEKTPIFLVSGSIDKKSIETIKTLDITQVHVKPFDADRVVDSIQKVLSQKQTA